MAHVTTAAMKHWGTHMAHVTAKIRMRIHITGIHNRGPHVAGTVVVVAVAVVAVTVVAIVAVVAVVGTRIAIVDGLRHPLVDGIAHGVITDDLIDGINRYAIGQVIDNAAFTGIWLHGHIGHEGRGSRASRYCDAVHTGRGEEAEKCFHRGWWSVDPLF